jgi:ATP-dependent DNA helicase 2 subunit 1
MVENNIEFEVFPLVFDKNKFRYARFYVNLLQAEPDELDRDLLEPAEKLEELNIRLRRKEFVKKAVGQMDFQITEGNKLGVKIYSLFRKLKKPTSLTLHKDKETRLTRLTKYVSKDTNEDIEPEDLGKYYPLGNEKVVFSNEELEMIKNINGQEFTLIGFKPKSSLKIYHNAGPSVFVVADDERISNSSKVFDALIKEMEKKDKIAIVKIRLKENSTMRFCAMIPQEERKDSEGLTPSGFHIIILPYSDELRKLDSFFPKNEAQPTEEEIDCAIDVINSLTVEDFDPKSFENPDIQNFYSVLQALALKENVPEEIVDYLQPDIEAMQSRIDVFAGFNRCFFGEFNEFNTHGTGFDDVNNQANQFKVKRVVGELKNKAENNEDRIGQIKDKIMKGDVRSLKIADLEFLIEALNLQVDKKLQKKDLVSQLAKMV